MNALIAINFSIVLVGWIMTNQNKKSIKHIYFI